MRGDWVQQTWDGRFAAHLKHGANSIERIQPLDHRWLSILVEEVGEVAHAQTYDSGAGLAELHAELIDVLSVASAWADALDRVLEQRAIADGQES